LTRLTRSPLAVLAGRQGVCGRRSAAPAGGPDAGGTGQAVVDVDPLGRDAEGLQDVALGGENVVAASPSSRAVEVRGVTRSATATPWRCGRECVGFGGYRAGRTPKVIAGGRPWFWQGMGRSLPHPTAKTQGVRCQ
jgi:hypothetical protein